MNILICGGGGFIGCNLLEQLIANNSKNITVIDRLNYASNPEVLRHLEESVGIKFFHRDIGDQVFIQSALKELEPDIVINLAAETHVDNSIADPMIFVENNIGATFRFLAECLRYFKDERQKAGTRPFRLLQISTDEVFGSINDVENACDEESQYQPSNPYSATKAAADHMISAMQNTYGLPAIIAYLSNNYGPYQHREKFIPKVISSAINGSEIPVYGDGSQRRTWMNVKDTCDAIISVIEKGKVGSKYSFGGADEVQNLDLAQRICSILDKLQPLPGGRSYKSQITLVKDRPGHDARYALNSEKAKNELNWAPQVSFQSGLVSTTQWYLKKMINEK